jgi:hypothetical protein
MSTEVETEVEVTIETLEDTLNRTLTFLGGVARDVSIFAALRGRGYSQKEHNEGVKLMMRATGYTDGEISSATFNVATQDAIKTVDSWDEDGMRLVGATLRHRFPEQYKFVMGGLKASTGMAAVAGVGTLLTRLDALESGEGRKATRKADHAALAKLADRGLDADERARLRKLVNTALSVSADADNHEKVLADDAARQAEYLEALKALRVWYVEWADVARVEIKRRDRLIRLGMASPKRRKRDDDDDEEGDPNKTKT